MDSRKTGVSALYDHKSTAHSAVHTKGGAEDSRIANQGTPLVALMAQPRCPAVLLQQHVVNCFQGRVCQVTPRCCDLSLQSLDLM